MIEVTIQTTRDAWRPALVITAEDHHNGTVRTLYHDELLRMLSTRETTPEASALRVALRRAVRRARIHRTMATNPCGSGWTGDRCTRPLEP